MERLEADAQRAVARASGGAELGDELRTLLERLGEHMGFEDELLQPALRQADPWGPERVELFCADHVRQRELIGMLLERIAARPDASELGLLALGFIAVLRADMAYEEETFLGQELLRDDPIITSPEPE
jgi:hypothetical protein